MSRNYPAKRTNKAPSSLTPEKEVRFLEHLANGISLAGAARAVGVSHETVYTRKRDHADFAAKIAAAREAGSDRMEDALLGMGIKDKQYTPLIFLLKGRRPHIYRDNVAVTGGDGGALAVVHRVERVVLDDSDDRTILEHDT